jgi:hypothetical protein
MLKMKADGKVEVYININIPLDSCLLPTQDEVDKYYEACRRENHRTCSEKQRKRQHGANPEPSGD